MKFSDNIEILSNQSITLITGATSGETATVKIITLASGAWETDDAAGFFKIYYFTKKII